MLPAEVVQGDAGFAERFKREAKAMARLSHPGIVAVHDAGETGDGLLYFVMDFLEGTDVQQLGNGRVRDSRRVARMPRRSPRCLTGK